MPLYGISNFSTVTLLGSTSGTIQLSPTAVSGTTTITFPATTGTVITTGDTGTVTSTMILNGTILDTDINASAAIAITKLAASTISGVSLGNNLNTLTISAPLSGTSYNGSSAVSIGLASAYGDTTNPYGSKTANYVLAAPNGSAGVPSFRALVASDIPTLNQNTSGTAAGLSATLAIGSGGTNSTSYTAPANSVNPLIWYNGTSLVADTAVTDAGYNATTHTLYSNNFYVGGTISLAGSTGSSGQVLTSNGSGAPTWSTAGGGGASLSTVAATTTYYLGLSANTTGTWTDARVDTSNLYYTSGDQTLYATNFNTASDERLKYDIETIQSAVNTISDMRGVGFSWKETGHKSYGVIAQELEQILPELVNTVDDKKSVNYNALFGFFIEAIKELKFRIEELENR